MQLRNGHSYTTRKHVQRTHAKLPSAAAAPMIAAPMRIKHLVPPKIKHRPQKPPANVRRGAEEQEEDYIESFKKSVPTPPQEIGQGEMGFWARGQIDPVCYASADPSTRHGFREEKPPCRRAIVLDGKTGGRKVLNASPPPKVMSLSI